MAEIIVVGKGGTVPEGSWVPLNSAQSGRMMKKVSLRDSGSATSGSVAGTSAYLAKHTGGREPTLLFHPFNPLGLWRVQAAIGA